MNAIIAWLTVMWGGFGDVAREPVVTGERLSFYSKVLQEERVVQVWLPERYGCTETHYPVLFVLDGMAHYLHASGTVAFLSRNRLIPEMIVVALVSTNRVRDFTPATDDGDHSRINAVFPNHGGAELFLEFLERELVPLVDEQYRTAPFRVLCGHSFAGLFAIHAFLSGKSCFKGFIAASPNLWWDDQRVVERADTFLKNSRNLRRTLFLTQGREQANVAASVAAFHSVLHAHNPEGLVWSTLNLSDEDHGSVVLRSIYFGLRVVFEGWPVPQAQLAGDLRGIQEHFQALSNRYGYPIKPPEQLINQIGYAALAREEVSLALEIFEFNVKTHASSANAYDSYAEALEIDQQIKKARKYFEKAYQRALKMNDPRVSLYKRNLDRVAEKIDLARKAD